MQTIIKFLAGFVPTRHPVIYILQIISSIVAATLICVFIVPQTTAWVSPPFQHTMTSAVLGMTLALNSLLLSKLAVRFDWLKKLKGELRRAIVVGGMVFEEVDLFTNMIIFGTIGSGKTRSAVYPILEQITKIYNSEDAKSLHAKWGGLVADAKGDFHESLIYIMQTQGRDPLKDLVIIRPDSDYYFVEFQEVDTGERFFVSATGGTQQQECNLVLATATGSTVITDTSGIQHLTLTNGKKEGLNSFLFNDRKRFTKPEIDHALKQLIFKISDRSIRWLGWRERHGYLQRVQRTINRKVEPKLDTNGDPIYTNKPRSLRYVGAHFLHNGLTYNLIANNIPSTEAASRINSIAELLGNSMGGDNAFWKLASQKHMANCIELKRQVDGDAGPECSINDIQKFTTNEETLRKYIEQLKIVSQQKDREGITLGELQTLRNLENYFTGEWNTLDQKTKSNIISCVTNLFGDIPGNPQLLKTFCQPSQFSFADCMNDGKVYTLVLNAYPSARKLVGTCMKLDFQQTVLKRMTAAPLNTERFLMYLADENQFFFTTSGSAGDGDEDFMSIGRQARIFNLLVTQAVSSYLAVQKDENKINAMMQNAANRIFFMNLDDKTNRLAEATAGQIMTEKLSSSGPDLKLSNVMGDAKSGSVSRSQEKVNQYDHQYFVKLRPFEAVIFNTTRASGPKSTQANLKATASFLPKEAVTAAVNDYYQAFLENRAHELGIAYVYDSQPPTPNEEYEQLLRGQGILRSWFNGVAIAVPSSQAEKAEVMPSVAGPTLTTEAVIAELGNWPALEDLQAYNQAIPLQSDLEASLASDPLISREDTHIAAPTNKDEPDQSKGCENQLGKNLRQTGKRPNRILAHLTGLDKPKDPDTTKS